MIIRLGDGGVTLCPAWGPPAAPTPVRIALSAAPGSGREPPAGRAGNQRVNQRGTSRLW